MSTTPKVRALMTKINKAYGDGTIVLGSQIEPDIKRIPSGSLSVDVALGGGWAANQWHEVIGNESHGKTALVAKTVAANMAIDPKWTCVWIDGEHSYDAPWFKALGVDTDRLVLVTTNLMEEAYQIAIDCLESREIDGVVIDSLPSLSPASEDEKSIEEVSVGLGALITNRFFRKQNSATKRSLTEVERPVTGWIINQWREKIGGYGDNRTTPGGKGKNFACVTRVECVRDEWIKDGDHEVGIVIKVRCLKNKTAPPKRIGVFDFYFDESSEGFHAGDIDRYKEVVNLGLMFGVIGRTSEDGTRGNYSYATEVWRSRADVLAAMREDITLRQAVEHEVLLIAMKGKDRQTGGPTSPSLEPTPRSGVRRVKRATAKKK